MNFAKLGLALAAIVAIAVSIAQTTDHSQHKPAAGKQSKQKSHAMHMDMAKCMADMKAGAAKLDKLAAKMNSVEGADKIDATAAVVNEMLAQKKHMDSMCMHMCMGMKGSHGEGKTSASPGEHKHGG